MDQVLVLDSRLRSATAIIRNLGKHEELTITAAGETRFLPGMLSKYADKTFVYPRVTNNPEEFIQELEDHLTTTEYSVVIPVSDATSLVCSKYKDRIENKGPRVGVEDWETFKFAYDKSLTMEIAEDAEVPYPETYYPSSLEDVESISSDLSYPLVIKPRSKSIWTEEGGILMRKVTSNNYPGGESELIEQFSKVFSEQTLSEYPPLIQSYVPGEIMDTVVLADEGEIITLLQNHRVRTYPRSGGGYTLAETVQEPQMIDYVEKLLDELQWSGPAMFEFMKSGEEFYLMEINGRYWGSIGLSISCGLDIPWMHYKQLRDLPIDPPPKYSSGVQQRWLLPGDLLWLLEGLFKGDIKSLIPFFRSFANANHDFMSISDPFPVVGKFYHMIILGLDVLSNRKSIYGDVN